MAAKSLEAKFESGVLYGLAEHLKAWLLVAKGHQGSHEKVMSLNGPLHSASHEMSTHTHEPRRVNVETAMPDRELRGRLRSWRLGLMKRTEAETQFKREELGDVSLTNLYICICIYIYICMQLPPLQNLPEVGLIFQWLQTDDSLRLCHSFVCGIPPNLES